MDYSRRDFIKTMSLLAAGTGVMKVMPMSIQAIQRARAIDPDWGTTFKDAEHVVLLMQENRSFDHLFGSLQGVRGFNDPRTVRLPNHNLSWLQTNDKGETYLPYRLDIKNSKVTWMGGLPHQWGDQVEARNNGRYDKWLEAKSYDGKTPFTLGYYNREDLPFYYALADSFTISDQHFCSSLTGTTPNRLYYWTGTVRKEQKAESPANISNSFVNYSNPASWKTFPEILEEEGISWKIYQNELSVGVGLESEEMAWLENFTNNPIEWFSQFHVRFHPAHVAYLKKRAEQLRKELEEVQKGREKEEILKAVKSLQKDIDAFSAEHFKKLSEREQSIHKKAFTTNRNDPYYHEMIDLKYEDNGEDRDLKIPKGDPLYQFREDVKNGELPLVSWLIGSQRFSDHPSSPMFGAWYVSEAIKILTENPEVWKKTIFILTYDENDGYFDHIPPFTAPNPEDRSTGFCSSGIDSGLEFITKSQVKALKGGPKDPGRVSPIGMGYRVPFLVASPWSRGGKVNSQLSDNTSVLIFLEKFLSYKTGKTIKTDNISEWRRAITSDLSSIFQPYHGEKIEFPDFVKKEPFIKDIYNAKFEKTPGDYKMLTRAEIRAVNRREKSNLMPAQEWGYRRANALPYEFYADGQVADGEFRFTMASLKENFGDRAIGAAFYVYNYRDFGIRNYAIKPGDQLSDSWGIQEEDYHFELHGPNGFCREYKGKYEEDLPIVKCRYERLKGKDKGLSGNLELILEGRGRVEIVDNAYGKKPIKKHVGNGAEVVVLELKESGNWYDFTVCYQGNPETFVRLAGHIETGEETITDPAMGGKIETSNLLKG